MREISIIRNSLAINFVSLFLPLLTCLGDNEFYRRDEVLMFVSSDLNLVQIIVGASILILYEVVEE